MDSKDLASLVGRNIHKQRKKAGLTQGQLAELAGVGTTFISRVERGEKLMKLQTLYAIAAALHVSCDTLLYEEGSTVKLKNIQQMLAGQTPEFVAGMEALIRVCVDQFGQVDKQK